jgi:hypothetical protein
VSNEACEARAGRVRSAADLETGIVLDRGDGVGVGLGDVPTHAAAEVVEERPDLGVNTLDFEEDGAVGLVHDPAGQGSIGGEVSGGGPESDTLNTPGKHDALADHEEV